jgi:anti-sigma factor RsiW
MNDVEKMRQEDPLRQHMWDLVYGLLTTDETAALHALIKSDPAAARLYAEVRLQTDLVAAAAQVDDPSFTLSVPGVATKVQAVRKKTSPAPAETALRRTSGGMNWLAGIAAAALSILIAWGLFMPRGAEDQLAARFIVTEVQGLANIPAGLSNSIEIRTRDVQDRAQRAEVFVSLVDAEGRKQFERAVTTSEAGTADVELPGDKLQAGVNLQISPVPIAALAAPQEAANTTFTDSIAAVDRSSDFIAPLAVQPEPVETYLAYDKPAYEAGETVNYAMIPLTRFSRQVPALPELRATMSETQANAPLALDVLKSERSGSGTLAANANGSETFEKQAGQGRGPALGGGIAMESLPKFSPQNSGLANSDPANARQWHSSPLNAAASTVITGSFAAQEYGTTLETRADAGGFGGAKASAGVALPAVEVTRVAALGGSLGGQ